MKTTKLIILSSMAVCTLGVSTTIAQSQMRASRGAPRGAPATMSRPMAAPGTVGRQFHPGDRDFDDRFRFHDFDDRFRFRNFVFFNAGFPFVAPFGYPYPYYGYYPPAYYGYGAPPVYPGYGYQGYQGSANGSVVVEVQRRLARAGFYHGAIDGVIGSGTRSAIRGYKRAHGLPPDGRIDAPFLSTMGLA